MSQALHVERNSRQVTLSLGGQELLVHNAPANGRPFLHPIQAPGGIGSVTENAPAHHPWQHGLYVGLNDVNGIGFWEEGLGKNAAADGNFESRVVSASATDPNRAAWQIATDYLAPDGSRIMHDRQTWSMVATETRLTLLMHWELTADRDLRFGRYDYGGLFLRMPYRNEVGGEATDSEGRSDPTGRARWVAVRMPLPETGRTATAAILDHPSNLEHPVPWRIDGELGVGPSPCVSGAWTLSQGATQTFRYGVIISDSSLTDPDIDALWQGFAKEQQ